MKYTLLILLFFCFSICNGQSKNNKVRYFGITYYGQDTLHHLRYGTYYISTNYGYFPTIEECQKCCIDGYKLDFPYKTVALMIVLSEFKNKEEWLQFNHQIKL